MGDARPMTEPLGDRRAGPLVRRTVVDGPIEVALPARGPATGRSSPPATRSSPGTPIAERLRDPQLVEVRAGRGRGPTASGDAGRSRRHATGVRSVAAAAAAGRAPVRARRPLAGRGRRARRADRHARSPASSATSGRGSAIRVQAAGRASAASRPSASRPAAGSRSAASAARAAIRRAAPARQPRRRPRRRDPRRRLAGRRRGAHPGPGDGRPRRRRRRPRRQGAARLPRVRGAPAGGPPPTAAVRGARPRRRGPAPDRRSRRRRPRGPGRREVAIVGDPPALVFDEPELDSLPPPARPVRVRAGERAGREGAGRLAGLRRFAGGTFLEAGWVALRRRPPRRRSRWPTSSGSSEACAGPLGGGRARRPSATRRLATLAGRRLDRPRALVRDPATTRALGARASPASPEPGDLICLWGELGRRQDAVRQGLRRRPRRDRHGQLADVHPHGRVRRPAAAVPRRPVPARRRGRRARRRAPRRAPGERRHAGRVARAAAGARCRPRGSTSGSTGTRRRAADDHASGRRDPALRPLPRGRSP